jgi:hypothetical protein
VEDLDAVATVSLEEGLPLAWVPRFEIVLELVGGESRERRLEILTLHFEDILDDCEEVLADIPHEWAIQCLRAVNVLRQPELEGPAQSHAGNIIDSIVLAIHKGRDIAVVKAEEPYEDLPLILAAENLVLRPLILGFAKWYPNSGDPIPNSFARHATAHAVGQDGVFSRSNALIAVMLATSLTVHFWQDTGAL